LNCTIGDKSAPIFVELSEGQISEIDGNWLNSQATRDKFNSTVNDARNADCPEWRGQKQYVETATCALKRANAEDITALQQSRSVYGKMSTMLP